MIELTIHSRSGQICRELKQLLAQIPQVNVLTTTTPLKEEVEWLLLEDSQLFVPALSDEPLGSEIDQNRDSLEQLLTRLKGKQGLERQAVLECTLSLHGPNNLEVLISATCEGTLNHEMQGSNHFGFDTLFKKWDYEKTLAELDQTVKNRISHRMKAAQKLRNKLESLANSASSSCTTT